MESAKKNRILISGSSGLVGSHLVPFLHHRGHDVEILHRGPFQRDSDIPQWDPDHGLLAAETLEGYDIIIHLGGANVASGLWTIERKKLLYKSRVHSTQLLAENMSLLKKPPSLLIVASATGFYGDRDSDKLTERSAKGKGFLADLTQDWEDAAQMAREANIRVVHLRFGLILTRAGGVLKRLRPIFKLGLGAVMGSGKQYWPWITLNDVTRVFDHVLKSDQLSGPLNVVSPQTVNNREFTQILNSVYKRPNWFRIPAWTLTALMGEMAREMFLSSSKVLPEKLTESGFTFEDPDLQTALFRMELEGVDLGA